MARSTDSVFNTPQNELNNKEPSQLLLDTGSTLAYQNLPYKY